MANARGQTTIRQGNDALITIATSSLINVGLLSQLTRREWHSARSAYSVEQLTWQVWPTRLRERYTFHRDSIYVSHAS